MNQHGRDVLRKAAMDGIPQIKGHIATPDGYCAFGVLEKAMIESSTNLWLTDLYSLSYEAVVCPVCNVSSHGESNLIMHLNDLHDMDFLGIAEKMPVSPE